LGISILVRSNSRAGIPLAGARFHVVHQEVKKMKKMRKRQKTKTKEDEEEGKVDAESLERMNFMQ
jgi:hypothetical protein